MKVFSLVPSLRLALNYLVCVGRGDCTCPGDKWMLWPHWPKEVLLKFECITCKKSAQILLISKNARVGLSFLYISNIDSVTCGLHHVHEVHFEKLLLYAGI